MMSCTAKMALRSINMLGPPLGSTKNTNLPIFLHSSNFPKSGKNQSFGVGLLAARVVCSAVQETSVSATATETKEIPVAKKESPPPAPSKRAPPAKAPAKPLPQLMEEDVIPSLKATLETQEDLSDIELSFQDNKLEGSFLQNGIPYYFWAFFPNGNLTGPKGFSLSSYGSGASTVEPFLIDEKKITAKHVVFWVEKRLAAQGILPVWKE